MEFIKTIENINANNLLHLVHFFSEERNAENIIIQELGKIEIDNGYGTIFIKPVSKLFNKILVQKEDTNIAALTFFGDFSLDFDTLLKIFKIYRKVYVPYDDNFEYFFNENHQHGDFVIKTFSKNDIDSNVNWNIKNFQIRW